MTHQDPGGDQIPPIRAALHAEAVRHEPDRDTMLDRIEAGMRGDIRPGHRRVGPPRRTFRLALPLAAVTCGLAVVGGGVWTLTGTKGTAHQVNAITTEQSPGQIGTATSLPEPSTSTHDTPMTHHSPSPASSKPPTPPATVPSGVRPQQGFLWSDGSVDPNSHDTWAQSDVTIKNRETITALDVRLRIALTPGVTNAGSWSMASPNDLIVTVTRQQDALVYEWVLKPGATLAPGTYVFAGQYSHLGSTRDAGKDTYQVSGTAKNTPVQVYGNFS